MLLISILKYDFSGSNLLFYCARESNKDYLYQTILEVPPSTAKVSEDQKVDQKMSTYIVVQNFVKLVKPLRLGSA